jgi:hypothetical protein
MVRTLSGNDGHSVAAPYYETQEQGRTLQTIRPGRSLSGQTLYDVYDSSSRRQGTLRERRSLGGDTYWEFDSE